ncbi:MAG: LmbE family protein, partial [Flavobacteriales bacterium]
MRDEMIEYTVKDGFAVKGKTELHRKWRDSSIGEVLQPMLFVPIASITPDRTKLPMRVGSVYALKLKLKAYQDVELHASATPNESSMPVVLKKGQVETIGGNNIELGGNKNYVIPFDMYTQGQAQNLSEIEIRYSHIPEITMFQPSEVELLPIQMEPVSGTILYIEGSGDEVDESLEFIGYKVDRTRLSDISEEQLKTYKAVIVGIRAFNTNQDVITYRDKLMNYVKEGGNMIVQYNTSRGLLTEDIGPFPFKLDRGRVTEESANVTILAPKHPVFNKPNKINLEDWSGWVQERGLYFADSWDEHYTPLLAWHDEGEEPLKGALIVAGYWKGTFTYTGISFFRQLPAGVPGAYRLMVNLIELK